MFEYKIATKEDLEQIWDMNIEDNPNDERWVSWKNKYISYNLAHKAITFIVSCNGKPVGEGTLLLSSECSAINGRKELADGEFVANVNALRIRKEYEGQGHISKLIKLMEEYASNLGIKVLTIGVEAKETRNLAIYLHWGFEEFVFNTVEDGELILYYQKRIK